MSLPLSYMPTLYELLFLSSCFIFLKIMTKTKLPLLIKGVLISIGISLGIDILSFTIILITASIFNIIPEYFENPNELVVLPIQTIHLLDLAVEIINVVLNVIIAFFFFKLKRLKKGFVFLENKKATRIGIAFSIMIMVFRSYFDDIVYLLIAVNLCTIGIDLWWRNQTTMLYKQRLAEHAMKEKDTQIKKLTESNDFLAKTVHRDNKLIPAMYHAVRIFIDQKDMNFEIKKKGSNILAELDEIMEERRDTNLKIQQDFKSITATGGILIDSVLNHMFNKAIKEGVHFDVVITAEIKNLIEEKISKQKLETLLSDIIENALIAVSYSTYKKVLLTRALIDGFYEIEIFDTGIPFDSDVLDCLGKEKITIHGDENGSGIGYLTIFEILKEVKASLTVFEYPQEKYRFTKSVKIRFDQKNEYIVKINSNKYELN